MTGRLEHSLIFVAGLIVGLFSACTLYFFIEPGDSKESSKPVTRQISGAPIIHKDFSYKGSSIGFTTSAEGKGVIETEVPKVLIPEARAWMRRRHGIQCSLGYAYGLDGGSPLADVAYWYRVGSFSFGGGISLSKESIGIKAGFLYWFEI